MAGLQTLVDELGSRLQRSVAIDDAQFRLQVYSPHFGPVDETRLDSILHREAPAASVAWVVSLGVAKATAPVRLSANPDLGLLPRVCAPVRCQSILLGYVTIIDADDSLTDAELALVQETADEAGLVMYREQLLRELEHSRERELLRDLLSDDAAVGEHAAQQLVDEELFTPGAGVVVLAVQGNRRDAHGDGRDDVQVVIGTALMHARRVFPERQALQLSRLDHGFLLAAARPGGRRTDINEVAQAIHAEVSKALGDDHRVLIGIGEPQNALAQAKTSYLQARQSLRVAEIVPSFGSVVPWSQLGIYGILSRLPADELTSAGLHPGLLRLFAVAGADPMLETLEAYLDNAGDAQRTSSQLLIHRTSLYYRLKKIEEITGTKLSSGGDRLALHLGLKLARLAGVHPVSGQT